MFSLLRYGAYLILVLMVLFFLDRYGISVRQAAMTAGGNIKDFFEDIGSKDGIDDIKNIDLLKNATSTSTTTPVKISGKKNTPTSFSVAGIIKHTNIERTKLGLKPLTVNIKLNSSAGLKTDDILLNQYFEHVSPTGKSASDLVRETKYDFELIGENLALGNFGSDQKLVAAWMGSPKHRANILNPKFTEIGVSVAKGVYKEQEQWIFVQHFGKPQPNCVRSDSNLKDKIDVEKKVLEAEEAIIKSLVADMDLSLIHI